MEVEEFTKTMSETTLKITNIHQQIITKTDSLEQVLSSDGIEKISNSISILMSRIETLESSFKNLKPEPEKFNYINLLVAIFGLTFLFFLFAVFLNKTYNFGISDNSVVLAFVGILATFIVISNYAQVKEIEHKFEQKIDEIKEQFYTKSEIDNNSEFIRKSDIKTIEYRVEMYKNMLDSYIVWKSEDKNKEMSFLDLSMNALYYYNRINEIGPYSVDGITLFIKRLSSNKIEISKDKKNSYLKIAYNYPGSKQEEIINFLQNIKEKND
jgi:hypothetical protein